MCQFVPNFLSYVSVKYLNWLTVGKVTTILQRVNFFFIETVYKRSYRYKPSKLAVYFHECIAVVQAVLHVWLRSHHPGIGLSYIASIPVNRPTMLNDHCWIVFAVRDDRCAVVELEELGAVGGDRMTATERRLGEAKVQTFDRGTRGSTNRPCPSSVFLRHVTIHVGRSKYTELWVVFDLKF